MTAPTDFQVQEVSALADFTVKYGATFPGSPEIRRAGPHGGELILYRRVTARETPVCYPPAFPR